MGYTAHQMLVDLTSNTACAFFLCFLSTLMMHRNLAIDHFIDKLFRFVDTICYLCKKNWLAIKSCGLYILIGCYDNTITFFNLLCCQTILNTAGTICFNLDRNAHFISFFLKGFRCHKCMCDTGRTCCNCKDSVSCLFRCVFFLIFCCFSKLIRELFHLIFAADI